MRHIANSLTPYIATLDPDAEYWFEEGCYINELHNQDFDQTVSIAQARVGPGMRTRWHRLHGIVERYVLLSGRGCVEVGDRAGRDVRPGDVVLIPPGYRQRITCTGVEDLVFLATCTPRFVREAYEGVDESESDDSGGGGDSDSDSDSDGDGVGDQ